MEKDEILMTFFENIRSDPVIDPGHIALFMALFHLWIDSGEPGLLGIRRKEIMPLSKISSTTTYFKKLQDLQATGSIEYIPSKKKGEMSCVRFRKEENDGRSKTNNLSE